MKRFLNLLVGIVVFGVCMAQNTIAEINEIKMSKTYFTAEATAKNFEDAKKMALVNLMMKIDSYCEDMEIDRIAENQVEEVVQTKSLKRGDEAIMAFVYVPRSIAAKITQQEGTISTPATCPSVSHSSTNNIPDIIKRVCELGTYAQLQYWLDMAESNGMIKIWGKWRMMNNREACYLVMVNANRQIVSVLSPVHDGCRTEVNTGVLMDSEKMKSFNNKCVPICVLVK